jgi:hypothetical protein
MIALLKTCAGTEFEDEVRELATTHTRVEEKAQVRRVVARAARSPSRLRHPPGRPPAQPRGGAGQAPSPCLPPYLRPRDAERGDAGGRPADARRLA